MDEAFGFGFGYKMSLDGVRGLASGYALIYTYGRWVGSLWLAF